jgi:hypothetical protein
MQATLNITKVNTITKVDGVPNVPLTKSPENLAFLFERLLKKCLDGQIQVRMC